MFTPHVPDIELGLFDISKLPPTRLQAAAEAARDRVNQHNETNKKLIEKGYVGLDPGSPAAANQAFLAGNPETHAQADLALRQIELTRELAKQQGGGGGPRAGARRQGF